jgi:hypothetical protein
VTVGHADGEERKLIVAETSWDSFKASDALRVAAPNCIQAFEDEAMAHDGLGRSSS